MWLRRISGVLPTVATMFSAMFMTVVFWMTCSGWLSREKCFAPD
jgi:hypothetical protein